MDRWCKAARDLLQELREGKKWQESSMRKAWRDYYVQRSDGALHYDPTARICRDCVKAIDQYEAELKLEGLLHGNSPDPK